MYYCPQCLTNTESRGLPLGGRGATYSVAWARWTSWARLGSGGGRQKPGRRLTRWSARRKTTVRPCLCRTAAPRPPPPHWRRAGPAHAVVGPWPAAAAALADTRSPRSARPAGGQGGTPGTREPGGAPQGRRCRTAGRLTPGRAAAAPHGGCWAGNPCQRHPAVPRLARRAHHLRGLCRRPESVLRRSLHFLAGEPWLSGGISERSRSGCGASPQLPLLSGWVEGWKPFWSSPPSREQEAAAGGGGPAVAAGWARSCSPMVAASPPLFPGSGPAGRGEASAHSGVRARSSVRWGCGARPPGGGGARRRRPARRALQRGGHRPPPGPRRPPPPGSVRVRSRRARHLQGSASTSAGAQGRRSRGGPSLARWEMARARSRWDLAPRAISVWLRSRDPPSLAHTGQAWPGNRLGCRFRVSVHRHTLMWLRCLPLGGLCAIPGTLRTSHKVNLCISTNAHTFVCTVAGVLSSSEGQCDLEYIWPAFLVSWPYHRDTDASHDWPLRPSSVKIHFLNEMY